MAAAGIAGAQTNKVARKGRVKHCVTGGVFRGTNLSFADQCKEAARLGIVGYDLRGPYDWPTMKEHGLLSTMTPGPSQIKNGINKKENHAKFLPGFQEIIGKAAEWKSPNVIVLAGDRAGLSDEESM